MCIAFDKFMCFVLCNRCHIYTKNKYTESYGEIVTEIELANAILQLCIDFSVSYH